ncbi:uncharacterized protein BDCG_16180 [Blastomyces dermatitidis ER-3]|uniref:Uncharacterized protein n=2 Tax=Ajellomyces dermatitidis TaxID=5039 RepID=A0A0J9EPR6_AJEDA|nr:uncharacterized protein BDCG_16180 [Blastomyces dermatitidis ER-3]EEQ83852.2 hypothetical protein BDCG_16180 [Blastomyces dermatitidis ER-3]KMW67205.1 hypothetical protein BDDG_11976 [Blastomyces dermatitidis ATCC 18188]
MDRPECTGPHFHWICQSSFLMGIRSCCLHAWQAGMGAMRQPASQRAFCYGDYFGFLFERLNCALHATSLAAVTTALYPTTTNIASLQARFLKKSMRKTVMSSLLMDNRKLPCK